MVTLKPYLAKKNGKSFPIPETDYTFSVNENTGVVSATYTGSQFEEGDEIIWNMFYEVTFAPPEAALPHEQSGS